MDTNLKQFVEKARQENWSDDDIQSKLTGAGWSERAVHEALGQRELEVPLPPASEAENAPAVTRTPMIEKGKVKLLSADEQRVKSLVFEYHMMFLTMWITIIAAF